MTSRKLRAGLLALALAATAAGAACGTTAKTTVASDSTLADGSTAVATTPKEVTMPVECTPPAGDAPSLSTKPEVVVPESPPPSALQCRDLVVGDGKEAVAGTHVTVQYVGVSYSTKSQFDASWDRGQPFDFDLGGGMVIDGWDQGVAGMKVGGRRELVIPPDLAYGPSGRGPIKPDETLVFVVDLLDVS